MDHIIALGSDGRISEQGDFRELSSSGGYTSSFNLPPPEWAYKSGYAEPAISKQTSILPASIVPTKTSTEDLTRRTGDMSVYLYYINAVGWLPSLVFVFAISSFVFCISFPGKIWTNKSAAFSLTSFLAIWVKWWAAANISAPNERLGYYLGIYALLGILAMIFLVISCWLVFLHPRSLTHADHRRQLIITMVPRSGENFHWKLLQTVLKYGTLRVVRK